MLNREASAPKDWMAGAEEFPVADQNGEQQQDRKENSLPPTATRGVPPSNAVLVMIAAPVFENSVMVDCCVPTQRRSPERSDPVDRP